MPKKFNRNSQGFVIRCEKIFKKSTISRLHNQYFVCVLNNFLCCKSGKMNSTEREQQKDY